MDNSVYVALSKQTAVETQMDMIANNIANANTAGYKAEDVAFSTYLQKNGDNNKISYVKLAGTVRDNSQGALQTTGNPLDIAIQGTGYFEVQTPQGTRYTRAGNFTVDADGNMVTSDGYKLCDQSGQPIQFQPEDNQVKIMDDGRVQVDGDDRAVIGVFNVGDVTKDGGNLYSSSQTATINDQARVAQGMLENSNVNPIMQMTKMISVQRSYEGTSNLIGSIYDLQETAIRTVGKDN